MFGGISKVSINPLHFLPVTHLAVTSQCRNNNNVITVQNTVLESYVSLYSTSIACLSG